MASLKIIVGIRVKGKKIEQDKGCQKMTATKNRRWPEPHKRFSLAGEREMV